MSATELEVRHERSKVVLVLWRDGKVAAQDKIDPLLASSRKRAAKAFGIDPDDLLTWIAGTDRQLPNKYVVTAPPPPGTTYTVRGIHQPRAEGTTHPGPASLVLDTLLPRLPVTDLLDWDGADDLCCLDVDYHGVRVPPREWLERLVYTSLTPRPYCWHFSRGGGLHAFYTAAGVFTAEELAAIAALRFRMLDPTAGVELKRMVRGPGAETVVTNRAQDASGAVTPWLGVDEYDPAERDEWLAGKGLAIGTRYPHDRCPINPGAVRDKSDAPVVVSEAGIYCHRCGGVGDTWGSKRPGFAPWSAILGHPSAGDVGSMIAKLCHWGHARLVLTQRYDMPESLARLSYRAACKSYHEGKPTEPLIPNVFNQWTEDLFRCGSIWQVGSIEQDKKITAVIEQLPACQYVDEEGRVRTNPAPVQLFLQNNDLTKYGYPAVSPVRGFRLTHPFLPPAKTLVETLVPGLKHPPRYAKRSVRMREDAAWDRIEQVAPGIDRALVYLTMCAAGVAQETQCGLSPFVFVAGPTGAGKTTTAKFAAGILGSKTGDAVFDADTTRFRQIIHSAKQTSCVVTVSEILKDAARRSKLNAKEALDPFLNLTPDSESWKAYYGSRPFGVVPAVFCSEPVCPPAVTEDAQLGRRIRYWHVKGEKKLWTQRFVDAGLETPHLIRNLGRDVAEACDAILSECVDRFFSLPMSWEAMAEALGCHTIRGNEEFDDQTGRMREFFDLVCAAPPIANPRLAARYGRGFKQISWGEGTEDDLLAAYAAFADGPGTPERFTSRRLQSADWPGILGVTDSVHLDLRTDNVSAFVRFRVGTAQKPHAVNEEILQP